MKGVKNRVRGCEGVAERIDISSKLSIYSLLDLHKLRWSVRGYPRDNMPILGRCSLHMHCRFAHHHGITVPRHVVHESSNNTVKREAAEVVCRWFLRGTPFQWVGVHATRPSETMSPCEKTPGVRPPQSLAIGSWGLAALCGSGWSKIVRKDESLEKLACAPKASQVQIITPRMQSDGLGQI